MSGCRLARRIVIVAALLAGTRAGVAVAQSEAEPAVPVAEPTPAPPHVLTLGVSEVQDGQSNPLRADLRQAVEEMLRRAGFVLVLDPAAPRDAEALVSVVGFSAGPVVRANGTLTIQGSGSFVDQVATEPETYLRANFAPVVADRLVQSLVRSPRWLAFAGGGPQPALAVAAPAFPAAPAPPPAPAPLGKSGLFEKGINVEGGLAVVQAIGAGRVEVGAGLELIPQFDLGPRWAFRIPIAVDATFASSPGGYAGISLTPGLVHRWRHRQDQALIPYAGGGLKLGSFGAGRSLLGLQPVTVGGIFIGHHHLDVDGSGDADDPNFEVGLRVAPELWAGLEVHPCSWLSLDLGASYAWLRLGGENVQLLRELIGVRSSF